MLFKVSFTSQTSGSNNKLDIGTFKLGYPRWTNSKTNNKRDIGRGPRSNLKTSKDSQNIISYRLVSHPKPLIPIISEI